MVALSMAQQWAHQYAGLVLVGTTAGGPGERLPPLRHPCAGRAGAPGLPSSRCACLPLPCPHPALTPLSFSTDMVFPDAATVTTLTSEAPNTVLFNYSTTGGLRGQRRWAVWWARERWSRGRARPDGACRQRASSTALTARRHLPHQRAWPAPAPSWSAPAG